MKTYIAIMLLLLLFGCLNAFQEGTFNIGGNVALTVSKLNEDADSLTNFSLNPQFGYFIMENLAGDLFLNINHLKQGDNSQTELLFGLGARYFLDQFYLGAAFLQRGYTFKFKSTTEHEESASYLEARGGYLIPIVDKIFVDLGLSYRFGIGEYGGDGEGIENDYSQFRFLTGLQFFF